MELEKKNSGEVVQAMDLSQWGQAPISSKDIVIPRINLMQGLSNMVTEGEAVFGEFRDSLANKKLGDFKQGFQIIPFHMRKIFVEYDATDKTDKKYLRTVDITPQNENLPYEDMGKNEKGETIYISRDYVLEFFCLLPSELKSGGELPYILSFRRTSLREGRKLATQMYVTNRGAGLPPPGLVVTVESGKQSNEKNSWAVAQVNLSPEATRKATNEEMGLALKWFKTVNSGAAKVDDTVYESETKQAVSEDMPF